MSDMQVCELCLEAMGVPPVAAHAITSRFRRDAATIALLRLRILQLQKQSTPPPNANQHPVKRPCVCDQKRSHRISQHTEKPDARNHSPRMA